MAMHSPRFTTTSSCRWRVTTISVPRSSGASPISAAALAPRQAKRWRRLGEQNWTEIPEGIDPSQAYVCRLPSGKSIVLFFYDGIISRQVAFERLLDSGEKYLSR